MRQLLCACFALLGLVMGQIAEAGGPHFDIVYAKFSANTSDPRVSFPLAVLDLAMKKMNATYTVKPSEVQMERLRAVAELKQPNHSINLAWTSMSADIEEQLRPIRIPIYRGLIGHRVFIIHKDRQSEFDQVKSLDDLKKFVAGQGPGWADIKIMESAGLTVSAVAYDHLFKLIDKKQLDYFPRGALEILAEIKTNQEAAPYLAAEKNLLLVYRSDLLFFTNKADEELASTIEKGLLKAYDDGSFMKLFNGHPYIQQAKKDVGLGRRLRLEVQNPLLSPEDQAIPNRFWEGR